MIHIVSPEKKKEYNARYYAKVGNSEHYKKMKKEYDAKPERKEKNRVRVKIYYYKNREKILMKQKINCEKNRERRNIYMKKYNKNYREKNKENLNSKRKKYYQENAEEIRLKSLKYYKENKPYIKIKRKPYSKEYELRDDVKIRRSERKKEYYLENYDFIINKHKNYRQSENGRAINKLHCAKHRELLNNHTHIFTKEQWINKVISTNGICPDCGENFNNNNFMKRLTLDHIIPISKAPIGFIYTINDVRPLCFECNIRKSNKILVIAK